MLGRLRNVAEYPSVTLWSRDIGSFICHRKSGILVPAQLLVVGTGNNPSMQMPSKGWWPHCAGPIIHYFHICHGASLSSRSKWCRRQGFSVDKLGLSYAGCVFTCVHRRPHNGLVVRYLPLASSSLFQLWRCSVGNWLISLGIPEITDGVC